MHIAANNSAYRRCARISRLCSALLRFVALVGSSSGFLGSLLVAGWLSFHRTNLAIPVPLESLVSTELLGLVDAVLAAGVARMWIIVAT